MKKGISCILMLSILIYPLNGFMYGMPVPSVLSPADRPMPEKQAGGYYYHYYDYDPFYLFFESILYITLVVATIAVLDAHLDNVTIIIYD